VVTSEALALCVVGLIGSGVVGVIGWGFRNALGEIKAAQDDTRRDIKDILDKVGGHGERLAQHTEQHKSHEARLTSLEARRPRR
jgi:hypothetical protein